MSIRTASLALLAGLTLAAPSAALAEPTRPVAAHVEHTAKTSAPTPAAPAESSSYADREARSKQVADYEGGNVVIVLSSGAALVLLLILLII